MIPQFMLADRLRKARQAKGLEQADLAQLLRVDRSTIVRYEREQGLKRVDGDLIQKWAEATDVPFWWFEKGLEPLPPTGGDKGPSRWRLPRLDSNQQPAGYGPLKVVGRPTGTIESIEDKVRRVCQMPAVRPLRDAA